MIFSLVFLSLAARAEKRLCINKPLIRKEEGIFYVVAGRM